MYIDDLDLFILKTITTNKKLAFEFINECDTKIFSPETWHFANAVCNHIKTYKDLPTLRVFENKFNKVQFDNIKNIWSKIDDIKYNDNDFHYDLERLKDRFKIKEITKLKTSFDGLQDPNKHLGDIQRVLTNIKQISNYKSFHSKTLKEALPEFIDRYKAKKKQPNLEVGIKTGYSYLDWATNGIKPAALVLITASSGKGKSTLLLNTAIQMWLQSNTINDRSAPFEKGKNIVYFSLEMPYEECYNKILSCLSKISTRKIENSQLNSEEVIKVKNAIEFIKSYPYEFKIVDITDVCANDIERILEDISFNIDCVLIDYLGLMIPNESNSEEQDWLKQGKCAYEVRAIGRKRNIPIFTAAQLNRKNNGKDGESIGLSRLARSSTISTHCTTIIQIEERQNEEQYPQMTAHIIKNRGGPSGGKWDMVKHLSCAFLEDVPPVDTNKEYDIYFPNADDISDQIEELEL